MLNRFLLSMLVACLLVSCGDDSSGSSFTQPVNDDSANEELSSDSEVRSSSGDALSSAKVKRSSSSEAEPESSDDAVLSSSEDLQSSPDEKKSSSSAERSSSSVKQDESSSSSVESSSSKGVSSSSEDSSSSDKKSSSSSAKSSSSGAQSSSSSVKSSSSIKPEESSSSEDKSSSSVKPKESSSSEYSSSSVIETSSSSLVATGVCKTAQEDNCVYDTLYDNHDGQTYKIVKIGEQWWMAENLRYVDSTQSVCYANNPDNCQIYGRLYDRNGALNNCPEGWRLPSEKDWLDLRDFAKKNSTNKYIGQLFRADTLWNVSELGVGYDAFGFGALPAGGYDEDGWWGVKTNSIFWLSDSYKIGTLDCFVYTRIRYKLKDNSDIQIGKEVCVQNPNSYFSVRCIKD